METKEEFLKRCELEWNEMMINRCNTVKNIEVLNTEFYIGSITVEEYATKGMEEFSLLYSKLF